MNEIHPINEEAWEEWVEFRHTEKKIKVGPVAAKKQRRMLSQYPPPVQQEIIDQSIMNSYQGLFPPKGYRNEKTNGHARSENSRRLSPAERVRAAAARHAQGEENQAFSPMGGNVYDME